MKTPKTTEAMVEEFYQHMLKSTPKLNSFERASLKLKVKEIINQVHIQSALEAEGRERQLKTIHRMELDAISCKSIEDFVLWRDHRKNRPSRTL